MPLRRYYFYVSLLLLIFTSADAHASSGNLNLTIYSKATPGSIPPEYYRPISGRQIFPSDVPGYAVIRYQTTLKLPSIFSTYSLNNVAATIDPTTVLLTSTNRQPLSVLEQEFRFDLATNEALLERYLGQIIEVTPVSTLNTTMTPITGTLLSYAGDTMVLKQKGGKVVSLRNIARFDLPELPGGLLVKPSLNWKLSAPKAGTYPISVSYQADGLTWWADYNAIYHEGSNANEGVIDLQAWVSILNQSGTSYDDAILKLMAGDPSRIQNQPVPMYRKNMAMEAMAVASAPFAEQPFFEYHLYTLPRSVSIKKNATMQIELFKPVNKISVIKDYTYRGGINAEVSLRFMNNKTNQLAIPLPAGRMRVHSMNDTDGTREFIGEDMLPHTPKNEEVTIGLGNAFDIKGERTIVAEEHLVDGRISSQTIEVKLTNRKTLPVTLKVIETLPYPTMDVFSSNIPYKRKDSSTLEFTTSIKPDTSKTLRYTLRIRQ